MFPARKGINRRNESTEDTIFLFVVKYWWQFSSIVFPFVDKSVKKMEIDFSFWKLINYYWLIIIFLVKDDNSKEEEIGSIK